ncbi:MAG: hypothetical protein B6242_10185 [Anaerolineaceae bacterium 4572_78]|nr:MAG: hypothetical protein B6242_10185 [Anaerolineaceae bacterium 4572_78]
MANEVTENKSSSSIKEKVIDYLMQSISESDQAIAMQYVDNLRDYQPTATVDELVDWLIKQKCLKAGAVGGITSGLAIVPGLGTFLSLTLGLATDIGLTFKYQAELVLEIAAAHGRVLNRKEKRNVILLVTGMSVGANPIITKTGQSIARKLAERFAKRSVAKGIPGVGVAASAGANMLSTYLVGKRSHDYFSLGPKAVGSWEESLKALTGVDYRKIEAWLAEVATRSKDFAVGMGRDFISATKMVGDLFKNDDIM